MPREGSIPARSTATTDAAVESLADALLVVLRQEALAEELVRLEDFSLAVLRDEILALRGSVGEGHSSLMKLAWNSPEPGVLDTKAVAQLESDHARYRTSLDQLEWFLAVVARENHGGHRQALGQYWKILLESLVTHVTEESRLLRSTRRVSTHRPKPV